ncbi:hypothetical protein [Xanthocytophaga agilis]|uniref:Beta-lactamase-inhibitor-like PepSY-like domain-containing protein n=1 Tax=Xanthocytophaga agilis TaxID=3048010 RepID=A0AAE3UBY1_9BACT|nr:hypothetical protein [Xanthocytophaga agilis]MDJ1500323.1 hypothetical protein [Xanthocytophaga agilis]
MKKLIFCILSLITLLSGLPSIAQNEEQVTLRVVKKNQEPKAVLDAIKKDFPTAISRSLSFLPEKDFGQQWTVESNKAISTVDINYYQVEVKTKDAIQTAVYDKSGNLLRIRKVIKNGKLPDQVRSTVSKFDGWQMIGNEEQITDDKQYTIFYKIRLKKGISRKTLFLDPTGQIKKDLPI